MRRLSLIGAAAFVLAGLIAACGNPRSTNPMSPGAPTVTSLQLAGPSFIAPGASAQFVANVRLNNGTVKASSTPAENLRWRSSNEAILQVNSSGFVTASSTMGEATITAEVLPTTNPRGTLEVVVVPDGTFRVTGTVREADTNQFIANARVEVPGTSLVATTAGNGQYRLFGVPPAAELRVTANGYQSAVQNIQINANATYNFSLPLTSPRVTLNGPFTLAIDVNGTCSGSPALPPDLQHRTYEASITTTGRSVDLRLTEPRYVVTFNQGNRIFGVSDPSGVTFFLNSFYTGYYTYYPSLSERLSDATVLVPFGTAVTTPASGGVSGALTNGAIYLYDSRFPSFNAAIVGRCTSSGIQFRLTPR